MKRYLLLVALLVVVVGCQTGPQFKNHPKPNLAVDFSPFDSGDCKQVSDGRRYCRPTARLKALGCDDILEPETLLGGLAPYPIAICIVDWWQRSDEADRMFSASIATEDYFDVWGEGGMSRPKLIRYVVFRDGKYHLVKNQKDLRDQFAPIESVDEALSYLLALRRHGDTKYGFKYNPDNTYYVDTIEDTHVKILPEGYQVNLYMYSEGSCVACSLSEQVVLISPQGDVKEISSTKVYDAPSCYCEN
jgi:hypothetical protein